MPCRTVVAREETQNGATLACCDGCPIGTSSLVAGFIQTGDVENSGPLCGVGKLACCEWLIGEDRGAQCHRTDERVG